jgi:hypothetical protein
MTKEARVNVAVSNVAVCKGAVKERDPWRSLVYFSLDYKGIQPEVAAQPMRTR